MSVLPLPVRAAPRTSFPLSETGMLNDSHVDEEAFFETYVCVGQGVVLDRECVTYHAW